MHKLVSSRFAWNSLLFLLSVFVVFHLLVIVGLLPFTMVRGSKMEANY